MTVFPFSPLPTSRPRSPAPTVRPADRPKSARLVAALFLAALLSLAVALPPAAAQDRGGEPRPVLELTPEEKAFVETHPVITLSDVQWEPLAIIENGRYHGMLHDYYRIVSELTGLTFKFVLVGDGLNFQNVLDALRDKRIDLIDGTGRSTERARYALFAGPIFRFPLSIASRDDVMAQDMRALKDRRVAVARGSTAAEYLAEHYPDQQLIVVDDPLTALRMVANNKADAVLDNMAVVAYAIRRLGLTNVKITGQADFQFDIYSLVRDDMPLLRSILDKAHQAVTVWDKAELLARWLPLYGSRFGQAEAPPQAAADAVESETRKISLTEREKAYLKRKGALRVCVDPDWMPVERISPQGVHEGMTADLLAVMASRLGTRIELTPTVNWAQVMEFAENRSCDIVSALAPNPEREAFLAFTSPYMTFPLVVATQAGAEFIQDARALRGKKIGAVAGYQSTAILRSRYPYLDVTEVPNVAEGLKEVSSGRLFGFVDGLAAISHTIGKERLTDLKIAGRIDEAIELTMGVRNDEPELLAVMQKAINALDVAETDAAFRKWVTVTYEHGIDYSLVWRVGLGGLAVIILVVLWNRKLTRLNRRVVQAHAALDEANASLTALLDNSGQGFLAFGPDGVVTPHRSRECLALFGREAAGESIALLLHPDDAAARDRLSLDIRRILGETDAFRQNVYLSLMPKEYRLGERQAEVAYRLIGGGLMMLILTDVTEKRRLRSEVERERGRLASIVAAVRDPHGFFETLDAFEAVFPENGPPEEPDMAPDALLTVRYRRVHTLKGLFLQFECARVAAALHELESALAGLSRQDRDSLAAQAALFAAHPVRPALESDLSVIREALGQDFFSRRGEVRLDRKRAGAIRDLAGRLLGRASALDLDPETLALLDTARHILDVDFRELLSTIPAAATRLAARQGKLLAPFQVEGPRLLVDPERFGRLAKSLVHLFRNAVTHGLETPEERREAGKDETGRVWCRQSARDGRLVIEIGDDGRGLSPETLARRAAELGLAGAGELAAMDRAALFRLLFHDGFTTLYSATESAGRGVGLSAVAEETARLGGSITLTGEPGHGAVATISVPLFPQPEATGDPQ